MGRRGRIDVNQALWFLPTLFIIENIYFCFVKLIHNKYAICLICIFTSYFMYSSISEPYCWFNIDGALYYIIFFAIGNISFKFINEKRESKALKFLTAVCMGLVLFLTVQPTTYNFILNSILESNLIIQYVYSIIMAIIGIMASIGLAFKLQNNGGLLYIGKNTLVILGIHLFILESLFYFATSIGMNVNQDSNIYSVVATLAVFLIAKPIIEIINNYFPACVGKMR